MDQQLALDLGDLKEMLQGLREQRRVAKEEHGTMLARAAELERTIRALDQSIAPLARLFGEENGALDSVGEPTAQVHAEAAERVMRQKDQKWRIAELAEALKSIGHPLPEDERQQYTALHSALKRRPKTFRRVERGRWVLVGSNSDKADDDGASELFKEK